MRSQRRKPARKVKQELRGISADSVFYCNLVDRKFDDSLPVASGLNTEWVKVQKAKNKGPTEVAQCMDDEAALSTRPDYPPSPTKFDREVADARLATAKAGTSRSKRKNTVRFFYHSTALSYTELDHRLVCCSCLRVGRQ